MPIISRFYGIMIIMYFSDHNPPHIHAKYSGYEALFGFDGQIIEGKIPARAKTLVQEWMIHHHDELKRNWEKARNGQSLDHIAPLE